MPFLEESWDGVGGTHCGQAATVGLEAFEAAVVPSGEGGGNSVADDPHVETDGRSDADASGDAARLRPIPCKLHGVPIKLRG
jgi:hypothetical protein